MSQDQLSKINDDNILKNIWDDENTSSKNYRKKNYFDA